VNNAGFVIYGSFSRTRWEDVSKMMRLHMETTTRLIKLFLQDMLQNNRGRILNVGSTGSFVPGPYVSVYCATKSYLLSLSEALAEELRGSGVTVTTLCPGGTKTEFETKAIRNGSSKPKSGGMEAKKVARIAYRAFMRGKRIVVPGLLNKMQVFAIRFLPRAIIAKLTGRMMSKHK
jgi:short-subunit dehydrogenase